MYVGLPGRIVEIWDEPDGARRRVTFPGVVKIACLAYLPDLRNGDYTIVHAGFALTRLGADSARVTLVTMAEYGVIDGRWTAS